MTSRLCCVVLAALALRAAPVVAQSIDSIFAPYDNRQSPGCAVSAVVAVAPRS